MASFRSNRRHHLIAGLFFSAAAVHPGAAQPMIQQLPMMGAAERLSESLRVLSFDSGDVLALISAGDAALELNDQEAAYGFFARAIAVSPYHPTANAGLGRVLVRLERADEALARFNQAEVGGADVRSFLADRGLAHDLRGDYGRAQADYLAIMRTGGTDEVVRRLALSQAIGGDTRGALATLNPLSVMGDPASYRAESFIRAMSGDVAGARAIAQARMSPGMAGLFEHFFARLPSLNPAERARAVHFGDMPAAGQRYASVQSGGEQLAVNTQPPPRGESRGRGEALIPQGRALGRNGRESRDSRQRSVRIGENDRSADRRSARRSSAPLSSPPPTPRPAPPPPPVPAQIAWQPPVPPPPPPVVSREVVQEVVADPIAPVVSTISNDAVAAPAVTAPPPLQDNVSASASGEARAQPTVIAPLTDGGSFARPVLGSIERVDPGTGTPVDGVADVAQPGDQIITPDGPVPTVPLAEVRPAANAPESLLPPGALPPAAASLEIVSPRPGFAERSTAEPLLTEPPVQLALSVAPAPSTSPAPKPSIPLPTPKPRPTPPPPSKSRSAATPAKADGKAKATTPAKSEAKAKPRAEVSSEKPKPKPKAPPVPERFWFQVATGGDVKMLATDLTRLKRKFDLLAKLDGATSRFGTNYRLVVGPFDSQAAAKTFEGKARSAGLDGYVWVTPEGFEVNPVSR